MSNWASVEYGAQLIGHSSQIPGCEAVNILHPNLSQLWLTDESCPQWVCVALHKLENTVCIRTIGWHCWHPYITNPKTVTVHISNDGKKFKIWDTFTAERARGHQLFCCAPISTEIFPFIALEIVETFGGKQTYMNRLFMFSDEIPSSMNYKSRESSTTSSISSAQSLKTQSDADGAYNNEIDFKDQGGISNNDMRNTIGRDVEEPDDVVIVMKPNGDDDTNTSVEQQNSPVVSVDETKKWDSLLAENKYQPTFEADNRSEPELENMTERENMVEKQLHEVPLSSDVVTEAETQRDIQSQSIRDKDNDLSGSCTNSESNEVEGDIPSRISAPDNNDLRYRSSGSDSDSSSRLHDRESHVNQTLPKESRQSPTIQAGTKYDADYDADSKELPKDGNYRHVDSQSKFWALKLSSDDKDYKQLSYKLDNNQDKPTHAIRKNDESKVNNRRSRYDASNTSSSSSISSFANPSESESLDERAQAKVSPTGKDWGYNRFQRRQRQRPKTNLESQDNPISVQNQRTNRLSMSQALQRSNLYEKYGRRYNNNRSMNHGKSSEASTEDIWLDSSSAYPSLHQTSNDQLCQQFNEESQFNGPQPQQSTPNSLQVRRSSSSSSSSVPRSKETSLNALNVPATATPSKVFISTKAAIRTSESATSTDQSDKYSSSGGGSVLEEGNAARSTRLNDRYLSDRNYSKDNLYFNSLDMMQSISRKTRYSTAVGSSTTSLSTATAASRKSFPSSVVGNGTHIGGLSDRSQGSPAVGDVQVAGSTTSKSSRNSSAMSSASSTQQNKDKGRPPVETSADVGVQRSPKHSMSSNISSPYVTVSEVGGVLSDLSGGTIFSSRSQRKPPAVHDQTQKYNLPLANRDTSAEPDSSNHHIPPFRYRYDDSNVFDYSDKFARYDRQSALHSSFPLYSHDPHVPIHELRMKYLGLGQEHDQPVATQQTHLKSQDRYVTQQQMHSVASDGIYSDRHNEESIEAIAKKLHQKIIERNFLLAKKLLNERNK